MTTGLARLPQTILASAPVGTPVGNFAAIAASVMLVVSVAGILRAGRKNKVVELAVEPDDEPENPLLGSSKPRPR